MAIRLVLVGGFLGAGKTTWLLAAAQRLIDRGYRVGLLTNDQGADLVDTALGTAAEIPVTEVAGGCFCCRFSDLVSGLERLKTVADPHIILAEPVGSCTDLIATVLRPLLRYHSDAYELAPLTVLHDSTRNDTTFSADVAYLYQQQLAEAELLLINKCDQLNAAQIADVQATLQESHPQAHVLATSAKQGTGLDAWLEIVLGQQSRDPAALIIDYERYANAEAALGWLNVKGTVRSNQPFTAGEWTEHLLHQLASGFAAQQLPIVHIKTYVTAGGARFKASVIDSDRPINWDLYTEDSTTTQLDFLLNVRVNGTPAALEAVVTQTIDQVKPDPAARHYFTHFECFSPLPPVPTHRLG